MTTRTMFFALCATTSILLSCGPAPGELFSEEAAGAEPRDGDAGPGEDDDGGPGGEERVIFSRDVAPVFSARCAHCHAPGADLDLVTPGVVERLRARESECFRFDGPPIAAPLVAPGEPERSMLWLRVVYTVDGADEGPLGCGRWMPADGDPLVRSHPDEVAILETWIRQGAHDG